MAIPLDSPLAIEACVNSICRRSEKSVHAWPPRNILETVGGKLRLVNTSDEPNFIKKNDHLCQARLVLDSLSNKPDPHPNPTSPPSKAPTKHLFHSKHVCVEPDGILSPDQIASFPAVLKDFDNVFDSNIFGYNNSVGPLEGVVNMGPFQPPQRKGRMPQYARDQVEELQNKCDDLEALVVFQRPEDANILITPLSW